ncbi:MAG: Tail Collar domain protein [Acidimicrobiales bacterium]|nr:Tail Collar domain protein [Acidimicrobiales bacterium]
MTEPMIGEIRMVGFTFAPRGWAMCNGQLLPISQNTALFSLLGTTYGGNGQTTFGLPDFRGRMPVHRGQGPGLANRDQGEAAGVEAVTLTTAEIPAHQHAGAASTGDPTSNRATGTAPARGGAYGQPDGAGAAGSLVGGSQPHPNLPPYLVVNFIIALEGIFPSRN